MKEDDISAEKCGFSIASPRIFVRSHLWEREVKEGLNLHNLHTDYVTIRSELRYLIGAKIVDIECRVFGENTFQRSRSGSKPDPESNREFRPVANTRYSTANNFILHVLQLVTLIFLEYVFFLLYVLFLAIKAVNSCVKSSFISAKRWLPNMQDQILLTLHWRSVSWWGNVCVMHCFKWKGCHDIIYELLPHCNTYITQDPTPKIVDTPLTLIFKMGQGACQYYV